jgi:hypothetical protein
VAKFFRVNRIGKLAEGQTLDLQIYKNVTPSELQRLVDSLLPDGCSAHGEQYLLKNPSSQLKSVANAPLEMFFELFRRAQFPSRPSRYQSWFAVETLDEAREFRRNFGDPANSIWEVEASDSFKANMSLLTTQQSMLCQAQLAQFYWEGVEGPSAALKKPTFWEVLLVPPVQILKKVE